MKVGSSKGPIIYHLICTGEYGFYSVGENIFRYFFLFLRARENRAKISSKYELGYFFSKKHELQYFL